MRAGLRLRFSAQMSGISLEQALARTLQLASVGYLADIDYADRDEQLAFDMKIAFADQDKVMGQQIEMKEKQAEVKTVEAKQSRALIAQQNDQEMQSKRKEAKAADAWVTDQEKWQVRHEVELVNSPEAIAAVEPVTGLFFRMAQADLNSDIIHEEYQRKIGLLEEEDTDPILRTDVSKTVHQNRLDIAHANRQKLQQKVEQQQVQEMLSSDEKLVQNQIKHQMRAVSAGKSRKVKSPDDAIAAKAFEVRAAMARTAAAQNRADSSIAVSIAGTRAATRRQVR
jgi:hypothetical protein